jgi:hypothetical protein
MGVSDAPLHPGKRKFMMTMTDAREELREAHAALAKAETGLDEAQGASSRARGVLAELVREGERLDAVEREETERHADAIREAIASGSDSMAQAISEKDVAKNMVARMSVDARRTGTERVVAELAEKEREAELGVEAAREAVASALSAVMGAEATAIAQEWQAAVAAARNVRLRLGNFYGPVFNLYLNDRTISDAIMANSREATGIDDDDAIQRKWADFAASLVRHPNAKLIWRTSLEAGA